MLKERKMKKKFLVIFAFVISAMLFTGCQTQEMFREDLANQKHFICYDQVNLREEWSTSSDKVGEMYLGETVMLTGEVVYDGWSDLNPVWYGIARGGWVTADAVMTEAEFEYAFGIR